MFSGAHAVDETVGLELIFVNLSKSIIKSTSFRLRASSGCGVNGLYACYTLLARYSSICLILDWRESSFLKSGNRFFTSSGAVNEGWTSVPFAISSAMT